MGYYPLLNGYHGWPKGDRTDLGLGGERSRGKKYPFVCPQRFVTVVALETRDPLRGLDPGWTVLDR